MHVAVKPTKHSAPGPYLGYALQPVRFCYHLLNAEKDATVSLELVDDVALHLASGVTVYEQTKSALSGNPLSDWSVNLWKTIANWVDAIETGQINVETAEFRLYVTPVHSGNFAEQLTAARTETKVEAVTATVLKQHNAKKPPRKCSEYLTRFLEASSEIRFQLVSRFSVESIHTDPIDPIRQLIELTVSPELIDSVCDAAIGMAKRRVDQLIRDRKPGLLSASKFQKEFRSMVRRNNLPGLLLSVVEAPATAAVDELLTARPTLVRQLELIEATNDQRVRAVSDYLRASADKAKWADEGQVFEESLSVWDDDLLRQFSFISAELNETQSKTEPKSRGKLIYLRCAQVQAPLDGRAVAGHFVHGCFNVLADQERLGWHPEYETLLKRED